MPYLDSALPFSGSTPQSAHASHAGAVDAAPRALNQTVRYLRLLKDRPNGLTDAEAATLMEVERSTINARRAPLVKAGLVFSDGFRPGPTGKVKNTVWKAA
jgi:hypothetical protein